ncbi:TrkA Predicted flavoprotein involved in K+ transport [Acidimicrobiia bacterium]
MIGKNRRIVVIGAGPGGIVSAHRFREAGYTNVVVLERDGDVGGTWQRSRYPGLACDIMSHGYSFSFNLNPAWTRSYATQPEILAYMRATVDKFDLWPMIRLNTTVVSASWDDDSATWTVTTDSGEKIIADVLVSAQGMFGELSIPSIEGQESFQGVAMHTGAWRGDVELEGKRIAVIGSAASGVQSIPELAKVASQLSVFQRSANWVLPKEDYEHPPEQIELFRSDPEALQAHRDGIMTFIGSNPPFSNPDILAMAEYVAAEAISVVDDPELRVKLTPTTPWGCMRPLFSNVYYPTFNRPNVELITDTIERITPNGIVTADGVEREIDVIVFATGYVVDKFASRIPITGRDGRSLSDEWADGAMAYLGITTSGYPNLFMLYGPNANQGSLIEMAEYEVGYTVSLLGMMDEADIDWVDVQSEAMLAYNEVLHKAIESIEVWYAGCSHYYLSPSGRIVTQYPFSMFAYRDAVATPDIDAFEAGRI